MNRYLYHAFAEAREQEIRRHIATRRTPNAWDPRPIGGPVDRLGRTLVHLGSRLITDRRVARRIEADLTARAA